MTRRQRHEVHELAEENVALHTQLRDLTGHLQRADASLEITLIQFVDLCGRFVALALRQKLLRTELAEQKRVAEWQAEQLLAATGCPEPTQRALGMDLWQRVADALNALADSGVTVELHPRGVITTPLSDTQVRWDQATSCWLLSRQQPAALGG
ncbi:hypothetical protein [Streptomyces sp. MP131-18]|uniref:hypothetical protein n=1 Tax=Streptomyces sp. MP131-18 TaxID=1857892 RepID=UPI00097C7493|nr:hypothetical protein [Streptomyces sp. MP131-18]ONK13085.1 hypothetical protein STBA_38470 [Streptomyces sp. MP131-18]